MLIQFSVTNFRSFREKQTFSMVAASRAGKKNNTFIPNVVGEKFPALLKVAAIYGPNASGKSSLAAAFSTLQKCARLKGDEPLPFRPFKFDRDLLDKPSEIEVDFIANRTRYTFYLAATEERIHAEHLHTYKNGKQLTIYKRDLIQGKEVYQFPNLEGEDLIHSAWRKLTNPKTLFLRQAHLNSSDELDQLLHPYLWLDQKIPSTSNHQMDGWSAASKSVGIRSETYASNLSGFLRSIDVPIQSIKFEISGVQKAADIKEISHEDLQTEFTKIKTTLVHKTALGEADFDYSEESDGTKNLLGFWLPLSILGENSTINCLIVDELDSSLHPSIVEMLVKRHISNSENAQIIFTTHDTHLMNSELLRRDQIWLTERDRFGATQLRSVYEFEGREGENIEKRYFEGRYRSLPILGSNDI
ncbi:AAA family ATPase [Pseudomonas oryzihabitans]|uniref:AAA family ATPase n=1 Tax=Pseudomonas oryzihabitans TaxID=47885 RepID=UPI00241DE917|nr:ATP-binding protein [Pseudomonas oryzihabitans]